jgi:hypothetical protein
MGDLGCALVSEFVEEHIQCSLRPARASPHETASVVINNNNQIPVSPFVGDLIDPDPTQPVKTINSRLDIMVDPGDDRPDSPPRNP